MANLAVQKLSEAGGVTLAAAASGGDQFKNDSSKRTSLVVSNGGTGAVQVTIAAQDTTADVPGYGIMTKANAVVNVAAGAVDVIGPFPAEAFNAVGGLVSVAYDQVVSVTVAVVKVV